MKRSESISALAKALAQFNSKVSKISKDANNPFFKNKYATLDNIIDEVRPILTEHGLTLMQFPGGDGNTVSVTTYIMHDSGEWIESDPLVMKPIKNDPQAIGSCITYARRYSLAAFLSLNTGEDDDGNKATHPNGAPQQQNYSRNNQAKANMTPEQAGALKITFGKFSGKTLKEVYKEKKDYLEWMIGNEKTDEKYKVAIQVMFDAISKQKKPQPVEQPPMGQQPPDFGFDGIDISDDDLPFPMNDHAS